MKKSESEIREQKHKAVEKQEIVAPQPPAVSQTGDKPLFHGHPTGNVEKLIEHGRQMGF